MMEYRGYFAKTEFDDELGVFQGEVVGLRDVVTFEGTSVEELRHEFRESVDDYLDFCAQRGEKPEKPCSGRFVVRIDPVLHRAVAIRARMADKSLNAWVGDTLANALQD